MTSGEDPGPNKRRWIERLVEATGRVADRPVAVGGLVGVRPTMWVNVAIDHRAADGEAGGRLLAAFERQIALLPGGSA